MSRKIRLLDDIAVEILSRLSAESLMRFKCVHSSWYVLVEDSKFVAMQLCNYVCSTRNKDSLQMLFFSYPRGFAAGDPIRNIISMLRCDGEVVSSVGDDIDLTGDTLKSSSCCNGIVCFYGDSSVIIANPGLTQFRVLPESCIPYPEPDSSSVLVALGFGLDFRANDYKVVRIVELLSGYFTPQGYFDVEVYTLSTNSWRHMDSVLYEYGLYDNMTSSYWNGAYYWLSVRINYPVIENGILSFNFGDEVFQFISIPEVVSSAIGEWGNAQGIIEYNGAQALVSYSGWCFDIWDMDSFGIRGTWIKLFSSGSLNIDKHITYDSTKHEVGPSGLINNVYLQVNSVLGFFKKDQLLLLLSSGQVISFNFLTNQMTVLPIDSKHYYHGVSYKSSLVSINS